MDYHDHIEKVEQSADSIIFDSRKNGLQDDVNRLEAMYNYGVASRDELDETIADLNNGLFNNSIMPESGYDVSGYARHGTAHKIGKAGVLICLRDVAFDGFVVDKLKDIENDKYRAFVRFTDFNRHRNLSYYFDPIDILSLSSTDYEMYLSDESGYRIPEALEARARASRRATFKIKDLPEIEQLAIMNNILDELNVLLEETIAHQDVIITVDKYINIKIDKNGNMDGDYHDDGVEIIRGNLFEAAFIEMVNYSNINNLPADHNDNLYHEPCLLIANPSTEKEGELTHLIPIGSISILHTYGRDPQSEDIKPIESDSDS